MAHSEFLNGVSSDFIKNHIIIFSIISVTSCDQMFSVMLTSKLHRVSMRDVTSDSIMLRQMISPLLPNLFLTKSAADPIIFSDRLLVAAAAICGCFRLPSADALDGHLWMR